MCQRPSNGASSPSWPLLSAQLRKMFHKNLHVAKHGTVDLESAKWEYLGLLLHVSLFLVLDDGVLTRDEITYTRCVQQPLVTDDAYLI